ncbi:hypothetical protein D049_4744B, partial [Vibrio parahaemolyticus VPTS-2010]
KVLQQHLLQLF